MKKKIIALLLLSAMLTGLVACGPKPAEGGDEATPEVTEGYELALITDLGTIDDKSFNQGAWEGLAKYAKEHNITHKYYQPQEATTDGYLETMGLAIEGGAKLLVCPGFLFEPAVFIAQDLYPDIYFILLDGVPHNADYSEFKTGDNVMPALYQEDQSGFLAGYAAVKDGYTKLGYMGGLAVPSVIRFGYGFVQGAQLAAQEMGVSEIEIMYHYTGGFDATPEVQAMAASWYQGGTEVIFAAGGAVGNSVMAAAEEKDCKVIGVDVDQSSESPTVITSATKKISVSVYDGIKGYYDGNFPGGEPAVFGAFNNGVGLPLEGSKFNQFTEEEYNAIFDKLASDEIELKTFSEDNADPSVDLDLTGVKLQYIQ